MFDEVRPLMGEDEPRWAPFTRRLADARVTFLTSAGLYDAAWQKPFDVERERREPSWGDPGWRRVAHDFHGDLAMTHLHVNSDDVLADPGVVLPTRALQELVAEGWVGGATAHHASVMGYQQEGLEDWRRHTGPEIVDMLRDERCDGVVLAPV